MKKILLKSLSVFLAIVLIEAQCQSLSAKTIETTVPSVDESVFKLDENELNLVMSDLITLENYVNQNEGVLYGELAETGSELIVNVGSNAAPLGMEQEGESPLGIPAFLWGCVLGWVGILLVYMLTDKDKAQAKKALNGCLVSAGAIAVFYVVYIVWFISVIEETNTYAY
jgi:hypothetical protein